MSKEESYDAPAAHWMLGKGKDGESFGPLTLADLQRWAREAQVAPTDWVSRDGVAYVPAPEVAELEMFYTVHLGPGETYGPTTTGTLLDFLKSGQVEPSMVVRDARDGSDTTVSAVLAADGNMAADGKPHRAYSVFISYRHADNKDLGRQWATWLHHSLETYEVPAELVGRENLRGEPVPASLYPVFRDEEELPADADLTTNIRRALEHSASLVVLCSPRAVSSRFVAEEIEHFKESGRSSHVLALLLDGEPNASADPAKQAAGLSPEQECLPKALRYGVARGKGWVDWEAPAEPIAADVRPGGAPVQGWTTGAAYRQVLEAERQLGRREIDERVAAYEQQLELAKMKIVAGALGVPLGELTQRDKAYQLQRARDRTRRALRLASALGALALLALGGGLLAWWQAGRASRAEQVSIRKAAEAAENGARARHNLAEAAISLADSSGENGNPDLALAQLGAALKAEPTNRGAATRALHLLSLLSWPVPVVPAYDGSRLQGQGMLSPAPDGRSLLLVNELEAEVIELTIEGWTSRAKIELPADTARNSLAANIVQFGAPGAVELMESGRLVLLRYHDGAAWLASGKAAADGTVPWTEQKITPVAAGETIRLICTKDRRMAVVFLTPRDARTQSAFGFQLPSLKPLGAIRNAVFPESALYADAAATSLLSFAPTETGIQQTRLDFAAGAVAPTPAWQKPAGDQQMGGNLEILAYHSRLRMLAGTAREGLFLLRLDGAKPALRFWAWKELPRLIGEITGAQFDVSGQALYLVEQTRESGVFYGVSLAGDDHRPGAALANTRLWAFDAEAGKMRAEPVRLQNRKLDAMQNRLERGFTAVFGEPGKDELTVACGPDLQRIRFLPARQPEAVTVETALGHLQTQGPAGAPAPGDARRLVFLDPGGKSWVLMQSNDQYLRLSGFDYPNGTPRWTWSYPTPTTSRLVRFLSPRYFRIRLGITEGEKAREKVVVLDASNGRPLLEKEIEPESYITDAVEGETYYLLTRSPKDDEAKGVDFFGLTEGLRKSKHERFGDLLPTSLAAFALEKQRPLFELRIQSFKYPGLVTMEDGYCALTLVVEGSNESYVTSLVLVKSTSGEAERRVVAPGEILSDGVWNAPRRQLWFASSKRTLVSYSATLEPGSAAAWEDRRVDEMTLSDDGALLAYSAGKNVYTVRLDGLQELGSALLHEGSIRKLTFLDTRFLATRSSYKSYFNRTTFWDLVANRQWRAPVVYGSASGNFTYDKDRGLLESADGEEIRTEYRAQSLDADDALQLAELAQGVGQYSVEGENRLLSHPATHEQLRKLLHARVPANGSPLVELVRRLGTKQSE